MTIVMGLDQHRATDHRRVARYRRPVRCSARAWRRRIAPGCGRFLERFRGQELEVALEATTGWRFVVEELRRVGASVHLAEPAETAGLRGPKKRAKGDRADARHLRELLMVRRLPESWIPPDHILDLRARVRLRHTLSEQRAEWQQRIQATLYHHGCPQRRQLMVGDGREWLAAQPLPARAREQVTVALAMIDALEAQIAPLDKELRAYARRQAGCKALMAPLRDRGADRGHDPRRARRLPGGSPPRARRSATPGWTSPCTSPISAARPGTSPARGRPRCAGRCMRPRRSHGAASAARPRLLPRGQRSGSAATARACRSRASC